MHQRSFFGSHLIDLLLGQQMKLPFEVLKLQTVAALVTRKTAQLSARAQLHVHYVIARRDLRGRLMNRQFDIRHGHFAADI